VVVAVIAMRAVQASVYKVVDVVTVQYSFEADPGEPRIRK
jgi:hypothetical protein